MNYSILLVDDTSSLAEAIADMLRMEGFGVGLAANGMEGLAMLEQRRYDLILTDLRMPVMDGIEFIKQVRRRNALPRIPIIVLSAQAGELNKLESIQAGADLFLMKPFDEHELLTSINYCLDGHSL